MVLAVLPNCWAVKLGTVLYSVESQVVKALGCTDGNRLDEERKAEKLKSKEGHLFL